MSSKESLHNYLQQHILIPLTNLGFQYQKSKSCFTKTAGGFRQVIEFARDKDQIDFCIKFKIYSPKAFADYKKRTFNTEYADDLLISLKHSEIKNWLYTSDEEKCYYQKIRYRLYKAIAQEKMMRILQNIQTVGMDFLNRCSDFAAIAETVPQTPWAACHIADMYFLSGNKDKALNVLKAALDQDIILNQAEIIKRIACFSGEKIEEKAPPKFAGKERRELWQLAEPYIERLANDNHWLDEDALVSWIGEACRFACLNLDIPDTDPDHWMDSDYQYWIANLFLRLGLGIRLRYPRFAESPKLQQAARELFDHPVYQPSGHALLDALKEAKMDDVIKHIADEYPRYWQNEKWARIFLYAVYNRKIKGYDKKVRFILDNFADKRGWADVKKQALKYLDSV